MEELLKRLEAAEAELKELRTWRDHERTKEQLAEIDQAEAEQRFADYIKKREEQIAKQKADAIRLKKLMV